MTPCCLCGEKGIYISTVGGKKFVFCSFHKNDANKAQFKGMLMKDEGAAEVAYHNAQFDRTAYQRRKFAQERDGTCYCCGRPRAEGSKRCEICIQNKNYKEVSRVGAIRRAIH